MPVTTTEINFVSYEQISKRCYSMRWVWEVFTCLKGARWATRSSSSSTSPSLYSASSPKDRFSLTDHWCRCERLTFDLLTRQIVQILFQQTHLGEPSNEKKGDFLFSPPRKVNQAKGDFLWTYVFSMNTLTLLNDVKYFDEANPKFAELRQMLDSRQVLAVFFGESKCRF